MPRVFVSGSGALNGFPNDLNSGCLNRDTAKANPIISLERAVHNIYAKRMISWPSISGLRTMFHDETLNLRGELEPWCHTVTIRFFYSTQTPFDTWRVTATSTEETKVQVLRSSNTNTAENAEECVITLKLLPSSEAVRDLGEFNLNFEFLYTSTTLASTITTSTAEFELYGVTIEPNTVDSIAD